MQRPRGFERIVDIGRDSFSTSTRVLAMNLVFPLLFAYLLAIQEKKPPEKFGEIDYQAKLNDILGKGITPEKNANVLIWKAIGPTPEGVRVPAEYFNRLGVPPPKNGDDFITLEEYGKKQLKLDSGDVFALRELAWGTLNRPWTSQDHPRIAAWLKVNEKPLVLVIQASKRPRYFSPYLSRTAAENRGSLSGWPLPSVSMCRDFGLALRIRAMMRLAEGRNEAAWQDLIAAHRLARLLANGGTILESLVGIAIDHHTSFDELTYIESVNLTSNQLRNHISALQKLTPIPSMADKIDIPERFAFYDTLQQISHGWGRNFREGKVLFFEKESPPTPEELKMLSGIDWDSLIRDGDRWYDRMVGAARIKERKARNKAFGKVEGELKALAEAAKKEKDDAEQSGKGNLAEVRGKSIGCNVLAQIAWTYQRMLAEYDRAEQINHNFQVAFALAAYRADNGKYPAKLADLAPKYLVNVPDDLFSGKPLIYKPSEKGYLLYSVGQNEKDDGGFTHEEKIESDDLVVRMPLPPIKK